MVTEITLASELFGPLRSGRKIQTIRRGRRDYSLGPARFSNEDGQVCYVDITRVTHCRFSDLCDEDAVNDGLGSLRELHDVLQSFYGDLDDSEEITVVRVELADNQREATVGTQLFSKLVRDRIPEIIERNGERAAIRMLSPDERRPALNKKLLEEAEELVAAEGAAEVLDEASDVYEVLLATLDEVSLGAEDLAEHAEQKRQERGGFFKGTFLEATYRQ